MNNLVWEKTLIGTLLANPRAFTEAEVLIPSDFSGANQVIWAEMMALAARGGLELRALANALETSPDYARVVSDVGNLAEYLEDALRMRGTAVGEYVDRVLDGATRKAVRRNAALIAAEADNDQESASEILDYAERTILSIRRNRIEGGMTMADLFGIFMPRLDGHIAGTIRPAWVPEVQALRDIVHFAEETEFMTIAARPGDGKSSFLRFEAYQASLRGTPVLLFNLENDPMEYARHFIALHTGIDSARLKNPTVLTPDELSRVKQAGEELSCLPLKLITLASPSVHHIARVARRQVAEDKAKLVMVDYLQLIRNGLENRVADISETTAILRGLALQMHTPVLAAAQVIEYSSLDRRFMDIYKNGVLMLRVPNSIRQKGSSRTKLMGFNLLQTSERSELQAVYRSLISKTISRGVTIIDFVLGERNLSIVMCSRFPFVSFSIRELNICEGRNEDQLFSR